MGIGLNNVPLPVRTAIQPLSANGRQLLTSKPLCPVHWGNHHLYWVHGLFPRTYTAYSIHAQDLPNLSFLDYFLMQAYALFKKQRSLQNVYHDLIH